MLCRRRCCCYCCVRVQEVEPQEEPTLCERTHALVREGARWRETLSPPGGGGGNECKSEGARESIRDCAVAEEEANLRRSWAVSLPWSYLWRAVSSDAFAPPARAIGIMCVCVCVCVCVECACARANRGKQGIGDRRQAGVERVRVSLWGVSEGQR